MRLDVGGGYWNYWTRNNDTATDEHNSRHRPVTPCSRSHSREASAQVLTDVAPLWCGAVVSGGNQRRGRESGVLGPRGRLASGLTNEAAKVAAVESFETAGQRSLSAVTAHGRFSAVDR